MSNCIITRINTCQVYYYENCEVVNDYYQYVKTLFIECIKNNSLQNININLTSDINFAFNNNNKIIRVTINYEHTLVKNGGRGSQDSKEGIILDDEDNKYLVRIVNYDNLCKNYELVIDYSIPNIHNVQTSGLYETLSKKHFYIAPCVHESVYHEKSQRPFNCLTTFINTAEPRRNALLQKIQNTDIKHSNINNCFDREKLKNLYKHTKVMINIHQTDHHHTFEELRVLPALQCGVIVICETSPLSDKIPYNKYIIWSDYDNIIEKTQDVLNNYDEYHDKIFNQSTDKINIMDLHTTNQNQISNILSTV